MLAVNRLGPAAIAFTVFLMTTPGASAQQDDGTMAKLKSMAGQFAAQGGLQQMKSNAQNAYNNEEKDWAACKALKDVNARASCYEQVHDRLSALVAGYLK
jgi:hypothetical protein